jgi:hypothetical protein
MKLDAVKSLRRYAEKILPRCLIQLRRKQHDLLKELDAYKGLVCRQPQDPVPHFQLANVYAGLNMWLFAIAEYRTGLALGGSSDQNALLSLADAYTAIGQGELAASVCEGVLAKSGDVDLSQEIEKSLFMAKTVDPQPLDNFSHNGYYRLKTLADHLLGMFPDSDFSVLDVGGGDGSLCLFVPGARYVLAEPAVNGISGTTLPFKDRSFDVVVACHVLEHIPPAERRRFLDELCRKAGKYVILLNPFVVPGSSVTERLELLIELTGAAWAKEHLDCTLPELDDVKQFAAERGLGYRAWPNGSLTTSLAMVFLDYYAKLAGRALELKRIHRFYNTRYCDHLSGAEFPTAYLVELEVGRS